MQLKNNFEKYKDVESKMIWGKHNTPTPFITFAIPTYKRSDLLQETLFSIFNQVGFDDYEIVITDDGINHDGSDSPALNLVKSLCNNKIILYQNISTLGLFGNWNRSIEVSKSNFVCTLHEDDMVFESFLKETVKILKSKPVIDILGVVRKDLDQRDIPYSQKKIGRGFHPFVFLNHVINNKLAGKVTRVNKWDLYPHIAFTFSGSIVKKQTFIELGGFNEDWNPSADYVFESQAVLSSNVYLLNKQLTYYRILSNESGKLNTVKGFTKMDYLYHNIFVTYFPKILQSLMKLSNKVLVYYQVVGLNKFWNKTVIEEEIFRDLNIGLKYKSYRYRLLYTVFIKLFKQITKLSMIYRSYHV